MSEQLEILKKQHQTLLERESLQADEIAILRTQIAVYVANLKDLRKQGLQSHRSLPMANMLEEFSGGCYWYAGTENDINSYESSMDDPFDSGLDLCDHVL